MSPVFAWGLAPCGNVSQPAFHVSVGIFNVFPNRLDSLPKNVGLMAQILARNCRAGR